MDSKYDNNTFEGLYTFSSDEVFEALKMWCFQRSIALDKNSMKSFDCSHNGSGWSVFVGFNHIEALKNKK
jgi:hypothetical protein